MIDLGPEGGVKGGEIVAVGTPEDVAKAVSAGGASEEKPRSFTGRYLAPLLDHQAKADAKPLTRELVTE